MRRWRRLAPDGGSVRVSTGREFFHTMLALTKYLVFASWDHLLGTMAFARPPPLAP